MMYFEPGLNKQDAPQHDLVYSNWPAPQRTMHPLFRFHWTDHPHKAFGDFHSESLKPRLDASCLGGEGSYQLLLGDQGPGPVILKTQEFSTRVDVKSCLNKETATVGLLIKSGPIVFSTFDCMQILICTPPADWAKQFLKRRMQLVSRKVVRCWVLFGIFDVKQGNNSFFSLGFLQCIDIVHSVFLPLLKHLNDSMIYKTCFVHFSALPNGCCMK